MANWWKKFWCWITGGHIYADGSLQSHHIPEHGVTCFIQRCLKCGEYQVYAVSDAALYCGSPLAEERIKVDFDGK